MFGLSWLSGCKQVCDLCLADRGRLSYGQLISSRSVWQHTPAVSRDEDCLWKTLNVMISHMFYRRMIAQDRSHWKEVPGYKRELIYLDCRLVCVVRSRVLCFGLSLSHIRHASSPSGKPERSDCFCDPGVPRLRLVVSQ